VVSGRNGIYLCQAVKTIPAGITPYSDVKDRVQSIVLREKRAELAHKRGEELAKQMASGKSFEQVAAEAGKPILETGFFNRTGFVPKVGSDADFIGAAFGLSASKPYSKSVNSRTGAYIIKFVARQAADTSLFDAKADSLTNDIFTTKRKDVWNKWLASLKQNAKIEDYRNLYYGS
jgi:hypothetical protein